MLRIRSEGMTCQCVKTKLNSGEAGNLRLSAGKNLVLISGAQWKAQAERIEIGEDGKMVLHGHVKLSSDRLGAGASVKADRIYVQVRGGKFDRVVCTSDSK